MIDSCDSGLAFYDGRVLVSSFSLLYIYFLFCGSGLAFIIVDFLYPL